MSDPISTAKLAGIPVKVHGHDATRHAIVKDGVVVNVVLWDSRGAPGWKPAEGEAVPCDGTVSPGCTWNGEKFTTPHVPPKVLISLDEAKAKRIVEIDRAFRDASQGLFVDDTKREEMRADALAAVDAVRAAATHEEAQAVKDTAVARMTTAIGQ
jgi:hypothetical protein